MKKRIFAILLTAALCIGLLPVNVLAEGVEASEETKEEIAETAVQTVELTVNGENEGTTAIVEEEDSGEPSGDSEMVSEDAADAETAADWEATLPQDLTGIWSEDVVAVAQSQIGYTEDEEGYTRYGAWYGDETDDWDAMFVSFCLYYADVPESEFPQASGADAWIRALKGAGQEEETQLYADVSDYVPQPGDLIFLDTDEDGKADQVGIAEKVETDAEEDGAGETVQKVTVIEGDSNDAVEEKEYKSDGANITSEDTDEASVITGYGILPQQADAEEDEEAEDDAEDADIAELAWNESGKGKVVINLGNGNGKYNNADYTHDRQEGTLLRYTTDSLEDYAVDGQVTINLPADSDLDSTFTVVDAKDSLSAVTIDLGSDLAYDYKLVGWVNIATGDYYDVSNGAATATVDLNNDNVFYADWIAATYDHGSQTDANLRDDIVSTSGFVTMHMYDYNDLFNLYSESLVQNEDEDGTLWEAWTDSGNLYNSLPYPSGNRLTSSFIFVNNGTVGYSSTQGAQSTGGMLTWPNYKTNGNTWTGTGAAPRDATTIWGITSPYSAPMNMLFDPESSALGVHYVGEADYLFWIDDNGYYTYNSKEAAATYNQTDQCFYVYDGVQNVTNTSFSCFLPYNTYGETLNAVNGTVNYFFGMDMEVNFYLPNATGTTGGNQVNGEDMVFNFSGDDDILIFVDDQLVLDMSGIHDEAFGSINFSDGTVKMAMTEAGLDSAEPTSLSLSSGTHDLKVYYMERGGYASNLEIQFNVVSLWEYESGEVQTVTAEKTWVDAQGNEIDPENLPDVYKNNGVEVGLFDVVGPASDGTLGYTQNGDTYTVVYTDDSGVTRTYVYDASGPTLTYTEVSGDGTTIGPETDDQTDSEGRVVDKDGYVVAWLDGENLYIRIDKQTLNNDNGWYYAWELMDPEGTYEVLELSSSSSYTTTSERENLLRYNYWSIIGDSEIEYSFETGETLAVILTEAAQEASNTLGDTKDAMGWVIVATENGIITQQIEFSQISELLELTDDNGNTYYETIAGVTSQSQVDSLGSGAIWYVVDAENQNTDATGYTEEDFHLYCYLGGTQYYLILNGNSLGITSEESAAGTFCYDSLGELLVILEDGSTARVEIQADGTITIGAAEFEAERDDIRIYTLQETETSGFAFTAVNTFLPDILLEKVDEEGEPLTGAEFTLQNENGQYYTYDAETDEVTWSDEKKVIAVDEDGKYRFHYLEDGTYILTETKAPYGYVILEDPIEVVIPGDASETTVTVEVENKEPEPQINKEIAEDDYERKDKDIEHDDSNGDFEENIDGDGWGTWDDADNNQEVTYHIVLSDIKDAINLTVHDYLAAGLDFESDTVSIVLYDNDEGTTLTADTDYTLSQPTTCSDPDNEMGGCTFEVAFEDSVFSGISSDAYIVITYNALTDTSPDEYDDYVDAILNHSYMTYGPDSTYRSDIVTTETDLFGFGVYKYTDEDGEEIALAGAEFVLERNGVYATFTSKKDSSGNDFYMITGWVEDKDSAGTLTSGSDGMIRIEGLDDDTYTFTETQAPVGYDKIEEAITVVIDEDGNVTIDDADDSKETVIGHVVNVENDLTLIDIEGTKTWDDSDNQDGKRPTEITIHLLADGEEVDSKTVTAEDGWKWNFTDLPEYNNGIKITYMITEDVIEDYVTEVNGYDVVNSHEPGKVGINVRKLWNDEDDQDGIRPESIEVELVKNEVKTGDTLTLDESNDWSGSFSDLDEYTNGVKNEYTVAEIEVEGYVTTITGPDGTTSFIITNSHTPNEVSLEGTKVWEDDDDHYGKRPESITVRLYADGTEIDSVTVTEADDWNWSFTGLDKYRDGGIEIVYTVTEDEVDGYDTDISEDEDGTVIITNTVIPEPKMTKELAEDDYERKDEDIEHDDANGHFEENVDGDGWGTWDDADNNQEVTYHLILTDIKNATNLTVHDYLEEGLDFEPDTIEIDLYDGGSDTVLKEDEDYIEHEGACTDPNGCAMAGCTFEVEFEDSVFEDISVDAYLVITYKALTDTHADDYDDYEDDILNHSYMTYGTNFFRSAIVTTETDLFGFGIYKYAEEEGTELALAGAEFVLERDGVYATFSTEIDDEGTEYYMISGWVDDIDSADTLISGEDGMIRIEGLDDDTYTITETKAPTGYEIVDEKITVVIDEDGNVTVDGDTGSKEAVIDRVVNIENEEILTEVSGAKTWNDNDNQDGKRPTEITIHLLADGEEVDKVTVTEADGWEWSFTDLPAYKDGSRIIYTITEDVVDDYTTEVDGYDVENSYTPGKVSLNVQKIWDDKDDQDGIRPDSITVELVMNGEKTGDTLKLDESNDWSGSFSDLDEYTDGVRNEYTVAEIEVDGYVTTVTESEGTSSIIITNTHTPETEEETRDISGTKTWDDDDDKADARPKSITVNLYQNDQLYARKTVTADDGWTYSWTGLPKYDEDGKAYAYTIDEEKVEYYEPTYHEGDFDITNTFVGEEGAEHPTSGPEKGGDTPKTGDTNNLGIWLALLAAAFACVLVAFRMRKRS